MPAPAVIHWVSPLVMTPPPPFESLCSNVPSIMYVTVSKPRCGCQLVPFGSPGAYSTSPIWSRWMNGSRSPRSTPAKARRTGKPSPSKPRGAVVTWRTGRGRAVAGSGPVTAGGGPRSSQGAGGATAGPPQRDRAPGDEEVHGAGVGQRNGLARREPPGPQHGAPLADGDGGVVAL